jgi:hypothetical protein
MNCSWVSINALDHSHVRVTVAVFVVETVSAINDPFRESPASAFSVFKKTAAVINPKHQHGEADNCGHFKCNDNDQNNCHYSG